MKKAYFSAPILLGAMFEWQRRRNLEAYFESKTVLITGGSTGLGFALAKRLLRYGANVSLCGRDEEKLQQVKNRLILYANRLLVFQCDVASKEKVDRWVDASIDRFGKVDLLINNAGILTVGPFESQGDDLFRENLDIMFWGTLNTIRSVMPHLKPKAQITNILSVGAKISIPHMSSYSVAKSAAAALSESLGIELRRYGITVTAAFPWLLRTGSYPNGFFPKGDENEFRVFSLGSALPGLALNAEAAVTEILLATKTKKAEVFIGAPAKVVTLLRGAFPGLSRRLLSLASELVLSPPSTKDFERGATLDSGEFGLSRFFGERERKTYQDFSHTKVSSLPSSSGIDGLTQSFEGKI